MGYVSKHLLGILFSRIAYEIVVLLDLNSKVQLTNQFCAKFLLQTLRKIN